jgi:hypothetical protein
MMMMVTYREMRIRCCSTCGCETKKTTASLAFFAIEKLGISKRINCEDYAAHKKVHKSVNGTQMHAKLIENYEFIVKLA